MWSIFGATYELYKCYVNSESNSDEYENYDIDYEQYDFENPSNNPSIVKSNNSSNLSSNSQSKRKKKKCNKYLMYTGIVILGIMIQPLFLVFKAIEMLMECYKRFGCWFYYFGY